MRSASNSFIGDSRGYDQAGESARRNRRFQARGDLVGEGQRDKASMSANFVTGGKEFIRRSVAFAGANGESPTQAPESESDAMQQWRVPTDRGSLR